jgi:hypothetical protein
MEKLGMNSGNVCCHLILCILFTYPVKKMKFKICKTIIFAFDLYGNETACLPKGVAWIESF